MKKIITWACIFVLAVSLVGCQFLEQESSQQESRAPEESFAVEESAAANSSQEESSVLEDSSVPEESESSTVEESSEVEDSQVEEESNAVEESAAEESLSLIHILHGDGKAPSFYTPYGNSEKGSQRFAYNFFFEVLTLYAKRRF